MRHIPLIKYILFVCLFISLGTNSFASIVNHDDGTAFVKKSEFEALKNSFKKQVDDYNASIDGKIDGAIAEYLSGIRVNKAPRNLFDIFKSTSELNDVVFLNSLPQGSQTLTTEIEYNFTRHYTYNYITNLIIHWKLAVQSNTHYLQHFVAYSNCPDWANPTYTNIYYAKTKNSGNGVSVTSDDGLVRQREQRSGGNAATALANQSQTLSGVPTAGNGSGWWFKPYGSGSYEILFFCDKLFPKQLLVANFHSYADRANKENATINGGLSDTHARAAMTKTIPNTNTGWDTYSDGAIGFDNDKTDKKLYTSLSQFVYREYDSNVNYQNVLLGKASNGFNMYGISDFDKPILDDDVNTLNLPDTYFYNLYSPASADAVQTNTMTGGSVNYYGISLTPKNLDPSSQIVNSKLSSIAGEYVYLASGCPIIDALDDETTLKLELIFDTTDSVNKKIDYKISNKKFECGEFQSDAIKYAEGTLDLSTDGDTLEITFDIPKKGIVWLNMSNQNDGSDAILKAVNIK